MSHLIYIPLADGFETAEAMFPLDLLRRAGAEVRTVCAAANEGAASKTACSSHGVRILCDLAETEAPWREELAMLLIPGGGRGVEILQRDEWLRGMIERCDAEERYIAAICAGPSILGRMGLLRGRRATAYPTFRQYLDGAEIPGERVVRDGRYVTAAGAGVSMRFGAALVALLYGKDEAARILGSMECDGAE